MKGGNKKNGFTLVEIIIGILIVSMVVIAGFQALSSISFGKVKLIYSADIQKQIVYFSQKLFEEIKKGGSIDYEEYFNRNIVGTSFGSGHYERLSGYGNYGNNGVPGTSVYGDGFYHCISGNDIANKLTGTGCVTNFNDKGIDFSGKPQRYGQYSFEFIDYNSNYDADGGDQNGDGKIIGDDDDEFTGEGPAVFQVGTDVKELYLLSGDKTKRTLFRWTVKKDPQAPSIASCNIGTNNIVTGSGCIGTVEFLKLDGRDYGMDHDISTIDSDGSQYDGVIDTWVVNKDFSGVDNIVAGSDGKDYFLSLFPDSMNVLDFKMFVYPQKDRNLAWKEMGDINVAPYVRLQMSLLPSWKTLKKIPVIPEPIRFSTTIALSDVWSK